MNQIDFLSKIEEEISNISLSLSENDIWNLNPGVHLNNYIEKTSSDWTILEDDFKKYFMQFPNDYRQSEMQKLIFQVTIDANWVEDAKVFINDLKNDIIVLSQKDFLSKIEEEILELSDIIFSIKIANSNSFVVEKEKEFINKNSSNWRIFVNDFNKYFESFPNDIRKKEMQGLTSQSTIDDKWIEIAKIFINKLKNDLIE